MTTPKRPMCGDPFCRKCHPLTQAFLVTNKNVDLLPDDTPTDDFATADRSYWQRLSPDAPTYAQLVKQAQRFGTDGVAEIAAHFLNPELLARLQIELDALERGLHSSRGYSIGKRKRRSADETKTAVIQLSVEGLNPPAIADKLGITNPHVQRILKAA